jgi:hypothetical protein
MTADMAIVAVAAFFVGLIFGVIAAEYGMRMGVSHWQTIALGVVALIVALLWRTL